MTSLTKPEFREILAAVSMSLLAGRIRYSCEKQLQELMQSRLLPGLDGFIREFRLSKKDRPDFFWPERGVVIEAKIDRSDSRVIRQVIRYTEDEQVTAVILFRHRPVDLPLVVNGKHVASIEFWRMMI